MTEPPPGWFRFGHHIDIPGPLEFSTEQDDGGMPLWERPARMTMAQFRHATAEVRGEAVLICEVSSPELFGLKFDVVRVMPIGGGTDDPGIVLKIALL